MLQIEVPPLRERRDDVPLLVASALARMADESGVPPPRISREALDLLGRQGWPGNVRELENALERALALVDLDGITAAMISPGAARAAVPSGAPDVPGARFVDIERHAILSTYESCGGNVTRTAEVLGLSPRTIHYRLREYRGESGRRH